MGSQLNFRYFCPRSRFRTTEISELALPRVLALRWGAVFGGKGGGGRFVPQIHAGGGEVLGQRIISGESE